MGDLTEPAGVSPLRALVQRAADGTAEQFVRVLETGDDALLARIHPIRVATRSIDVQTFIWANDETGRYLLHELLLAAQRGVVVRMLVDQWVAALSESITPELLASVAMAHPNLKAKIYNPVLSFAPGQLEIAEQSLRDFKTLNQRMHNKIILIDGAVGVTGGRNVENDYYDRGELRNYRDRDVLVVGPAVRAMRDSFDAYWAYERCLPLESLPDVSDVIARGEVPPLGSREDLQPGHRFDALNAAASDPRDVKCRLVDPGAWVREARFVADAPGKNPSAGLAGGGRTADALREFVSRAEHRLLMQSPYTVLDDRAAQEIAELRARRCELEILISTNSLASTDNLTAYALAQTQRRRAMRDLGLRIFELKPVPAAMNELLPSCSELVKRLEEMRARGEAPRPLDDNKFENAEVHMSLHAKTYVADGKTVWIGSFNLDPRSTNLNTEVGLVIDDPGVASEVERSILRDIAPENSWTVGPRERVDSSAGLGGILDTAVERLRADGLGAFEYSECFELKPGHEPVSCFAPDFHRHYQAAGLYPAVSRPVRDVEMAVTQAAAALAEPIL